jgi:hypothetical protein
VLQIGAAKARTKINNRTDDELSEHQAELFKLIHLIIIMCSTFTITA